MCAFAGNGGLLCALQRVVWEWHVHCDVHVGGMHPRISVFPGTSRLIGLEQRALPFKGGCANAMVPHALLGCLAAGAAPRAISSGAVQCNSLIHMCRAEVFELARNLAIRKPQERSALT